LKFGESLIVGAVSIVPLCLVLRAWHRLLDFGVRDFRKGSNAVQVPPREKLLALLFRGFMTEPPLVRHMAERPRWQGETAGAATNGSNHGRN
jgi:hypothetical protein